LLNGNRGEKMTSFFSTLAGAVASTGVQQVLTAPFGSAVYVPYETEGLSLLIQLGILANYDGSTPSGTLIGFKEHEIEYYKPTLPLVQGGLRTHGGASFLDLEHLAESLTKSMQRISSPTDSTDVQKQIAIIVKFAIKGLEELHKTYSVHAKDGSKKKASALKSINGSIAILENSIKSGVDHSKDTDIDRKVHENYVAGCDITHVAIIINKLFQPNIPNELKIAYIQQLKREKDAKILEYKLIKKQSI
jgi:hypothetical protein